MTTTSKIYVSFDHNYARLFKAKSSSHSTLRNISLINNPALLPINNPALIWAEVKPRANDHFTCEALNKPLLIFFIS